MCALSPRAMCRRLVFKLQKTLCIVFFYLVFYLLLSYAVTPAPIVTFVSHDFRVGDKYALLFLTPSPHAPTLADAEGADVFRRCGNCFITNNKGFLPITEYDAVLVLGNKSLLSETSAAMDPGKRYLIETSQKCIRKKFKCPLEPTITSFATKKRYTLCSLCEELLFDKRKVT